MGDSDTTLLGADELDGTPVGLELGDDVVSKVTASTAGAFSAREEVREFWNPAVSERAST